MFKKILIGAVAAVAILFGVVACSGNNTGADGYMFGHKQFENQQVQVQVVAVPSDEDMTQITKARGLGDNVAAFSVIQGSDHTKCTIYMVDPASKYQPEFIGHEFLHCVYGQWHTNNDSRS